MRTTHALNGFATLALMAALTACGGGGDAGDKLTPLSDGSLAVSNATVSAHNGTFTAEPAGNTVVTLNGQNYEVVIESSNTASTSRVFLSFDKDTNVLTQAEYDVDSSTVYYCNNVTANRLCSAANVSIDTAAHTITFNRSTISLDGVLTQTVTLSGILHWITT
jgi:hypothetical protein